ncbi:MAG: DUF3991 and TOPRIM domain-containing protein [Coriobacteriia bacterium]|nr:DUF3991 and TOPRIM domain-containing protein [Coriobacteriia bacterium]
MSFQERREQTVRLRSIPLEAVLRAVGAEPDRRDKAKWHTALGVLSVCGMKFVNWNQSHGGGGAIDLAMHLNAMDFRAAVGWLVHRWPCPGPPQLVPSTSKPKLALPQPAPARLSSVKRYLISERALPDALIEPLIQSGVLYADIRANAVFLLLGNNQQPVGAELRGTTECSWRGLTSGSRKDLGYFAIGPQHARDVILCESAIDAISCAALHAGSLCISTSGARPSPAWLVHLLYQGCRIYCGFDADPTGDHMAKAMIALHPAIQRLRPPLHDWNDVLKASA